MNGTAYAVFKFRVLHVIKESKTEPMLIERVAHQSHH
jgi:hypothetical protein